MFSSPVCCCSFIWHDVMLLFQPESFLKAPWPPPLIMVSFRVCFIGSLPPTTIYLSKPRRVCYTKELWSMMSSATAIIKMYLSMDEDYIVRGLHVEMELEFVSSGQIFHLPILVEFITNMETKTRKDTSSFLSTYGKHGTILQSGKIKSMQNPVGRAWIHRRLYLEEHSEFHTETLGFFMLCVNMNFSSQKLLVNHTCIREMSTKWKRNNGINVSLRVSSNSLLCCTFLVNGAYIC